MHFSLQESDPAGIFISKMTSGGPAHLAGLRLGDKVLEINGQSIVNKTHGFAVQCIQQSADVIEFLIERSDVAEQPKFTGSKGENKAPQSTTLSTEADVQSKNVSLSFTNLMFSTNCMLCRRVMIMSLFYYSLPSSQFLAIEKLMVGRTTLV